MIITACIQATLDRSICAAGRVYGLGVWGLGFRDRFAVHIKLVVLNLRIFSGQRNLILLHPLCKSRADISVPQIA